MSVRSGLTRRHGQTARALKPAFTVPSALVPWCLYALCLGLAWLPPARGDELPAAPAQALSGRAALATAHPLATEAGAEILRQGGNAFDAAVAVSAALAVVEPYSSGMGGGGFWLLHREADGRQWMLDGRERAPLAATAALFRDAEGKPAPGLSRDGPLAAAVPGQPAALAYLAEHYGCLSLAQSLAPAIRYARQGFAVTERYRKLTGFRLEVLRAQPAAASIFLHQGELPALGHPIVQQELAQTLTQLGRQGADFFYRGELARRLVHEVRRAGGVWSLADLAGYQVVEREPTQSHYRGIQIVSAPPPSSGGLVMGLALNILEQLGPVPRDPVQRMHLEIEAMRRAYWVRARYLGDPDFTSIQPEEFLSANYAVRQALDIMPDRATASTDLPPLNPLPRTGTHTTHFSVLDAEGNRVAATLSINLPFGSGFLVPGTGLLLNDEMDDFAIHPNVSNAYGLVGWEANALEPGKRPLSSMTPTFLQTPDQIAVLGTPGGSRIISMVLLAVLDFAQGRAAEDWISRPRYHHQYMPDEVQFELGGLSTEEQQGLQQLGHRLAEKNRRYGNMQVVLRDVRSGELSAFSDPRGEGTGAVIQTPPQALCQR